MIFSIPKKDELISESGDVKKINPVFKGRDINGYEIYINGQTYILSWIDFKLSEIHFKEISNQSNLTILYHQKCDFFCEKNIYEIASREKVILSFEYFKRNYENDRNKKINVIPYAFIAMLINIIFLHFYAVKLRSRLKGTG